MIYKIFNPVFLVILPFFSMAGENFLNEKNIDLNSSGVLLAVNKASHGVPCKINCPADLERLPYVGEELVFKSQKEVTEAYAQMTSFVQEKLRLFVDFSLKQNYDLAYQTWSDLLFRCFSLQLEMGQTIHYAPQEAIRQAAEEEGKEWLKNLQQILLSASDVRKAFIKNAHHTDKLSPDQRRITASVLKECQNVVCEKAQKTLASYPQSSFSIAKGLAAPLEGDSLARFSIFTANIICFPGELPYLYGGMRPWKERMDGLIEVFLQADAEIICLQEVWDPEAMRCLIDRLKGTYAYFVYNAGDPAGTLQVDKMGYSSGLFIASKLPLDKVEFRRFPRSIPIGSNRGGLMATCQAANQTIRFLTTHLQHGEDADQVTLRKEQLHLCNSYLQETLPKDPSQNAWAVLVGDLNIDGFSKEYASSGLLRLFTIPYVEGLSEKEKAVKATSTNYFSDLVKTPQSQRSQVVKSYEILDYTITPANSSNKIAPTQVLIPLICMSCPGKSLSDHNGLLTTWDLYAKN